ncbi:MAG: DEAD/DEAH box helicase, partial [Pedosphaera sp.]|nr:DEAD/DEAH box helicase [Pedosphaera sp.]
MAKARHPKAPSFVRQNLFAGMTAFSELEARIAALPDEQSRGSAFEVFAEAYLATQRKHDAATIWPLSAVPTRILQTLGLAAQDYGVDGVFQTLLGHYSAYQIKFRTNRPALTWRELSTFMGLADSPQIRSRVLLTNCDDLPSVLNERQGFFCIRGSDLDRLQADDFRAIEAWLADAAFTAPRKQPQPHQAEALDALLPALEKHDRVSAIMACGTGKTLVALWIAEHVARVSSPASSGAATAAKILVLVPSLALLRQILHEWLRETSLPSLAYLCVCSDPTVKEGLDAIDTKQSDLDFEVKIDSRNVREFLDAPFAGAKVVFSTYQSAQVVGAALKPGEAFDLAVFDEAHKTAGREGRNYAFALEDSNLPIRKRLFLTATPRHYNPLRKDKEGDTQLVFSMDRPEVYGPQAFSLTFAEAARRGIICGYKVIISVITSEMVTNDLLSRGEVMVNGDAVRARQVANQIALRDAIEKYGVKKIFTFHSTVKSAASFVAGGSEGIGTHLADVRSPGFSRPGPPEGGTPNFQTFHLNGTMLTSRREREMRDFRAAARAVMSNARCLTEGVDVPAVDMVAFLSPKRSRVDIVQATGRAMRRSPGKATGYVLVPLYVELAVGERIEAAVTRANFEEVWNVLLAMQEQDAVLSETIRKICEERGETNGFDDSKFRQIVEITGPTLSLEVLRSSITSVCANALGNTWDERYGQLKAFKTRFGHCRVPVFSLQEPQLGMWVRRQRQRRKTGLLSEREFELLERMGFIWHPDDDYWETMFQSLLDYKQRHGDCKVPCPCPENTQLGNWVRTQRAAQQSGILSAEHFQLLDEAGVRWSLTDEVWDGAFNELADYKQNHGNCNVPRDWPENQRLTPPDLGGIGLSPLFQRSGAVRCLGKLFRWRSVLHINAGAFGHGRRWL